MHLPVLELIVADVVVIFSPAGLLYGVGRQWPVREVTDARTCAEFFACTA